MAKWVFKIKCRRGRTSRPCPSRWPFFSPGPLMEPGCRAMNAAGWSAAVAFQLPDPIRKREAEARMTEDACVLDLEQRLLVENTHYGSLPDSRLAAAHRQLSKSRSRGGDRGPRPGRSARTIQSM